MILRLKQIRTSCNIYNIYCWDIWSSANQHLICAKILNITHWYLLLKKIRFYTCINSQDLYLDYIEDATGFLHLLNQHHCFSHSLDMGFSSMTFPSGTTPQQNPDPHLSILPRQLLCDPLWMLITWICYSLYIPHFLDCLYLFARGC